MDRYNDAIVNYVSEFEFENTGMKFKAVINTYGYGVWNIEVNGKTPEYRMLMKVNKEESTLSFYYSKYDPDFIDTENKKHLATIKADEFFDNPELAYYLLSSVYESFA